ncbi:hypothetical protein MKW92_039063 [Papaver armeniacum]|nr:hypothetical protein MKW92_039063 [Papaver armeniacum]
MGFGKEIQLNLSMITTRKRIVHSKISSSSQTGSDSTNSEEEEEVMTDTHLLNSLVSLQLQDKPRLEEEILGLKRLLKLAHVDFIEAENKRFGDMVSENLKNGNMLIKAEASRNQEKLGHKDDMMKDLRNEILELKQILDQLEDQRNTSTEKLKLIEEVSTAEHQDYQLLPELEQLQSRTGKHEQKKKHNPLELNFNQKNEENDHNPGYGSDNYFIDTANGESCTHITTVMNYQRKPKLLKKLKWWVIGYENTSKGYSTTCNDEEEDYQNKCFGRFLLHMKLNEHHVAGRKSCSSL